MFTDPKHGNEFQTKAFKTKMQFTIENPFMTIFMKILPKAGRLAL